MSGLARKKIAKTLARRKRVAEKHCRQAERRREREKADAYSRSYPDFVFEPNGAPAGFVDLVKGRSKPSASTTPASSAGASRNSTDW